MIRSYIDIYERKPIWNANLFKCFWVVWIDSRKFDKMHFFTTTKAPICQIWRLILHFLMCLLSLRLLQYFFIHASHSYRPKHFCLRGNFLCTYLFSLCARARLGPLAIQLSLCWHLVFGSSHRWYSIVLFPDWCVLSPNLFPSLLFRPIRPQNKKYYLFT